MSDFQIRHYEPADLSQVHKLYSEVQAFSSTLQLPYQSSVHWEGKLDTSREGCFCLVAVRQDEVVGQLGLEVCRSPRRRHVATLGMGVKASARRLGVGSTLLQAAIDMCERWMQITRIEIEVYTDNTAAIDLYSRHGFVVEGTCRRSAFRDGAYVDAHLMARVAA
ncbi:GNAT family N-acetyltransferase [Lysobacter sp. D1-1-M9]|uniref:GNAT family N-acetyltransferase n=1 Tax=Novilysobacter longmucuonensis TaxID=3098603 RepID=UPI002FC652C6